MTSEKIPQFIQQIRLAAHHDATEFKTKINEAREAAIAEITARDRRDARLQQHMYTHSVPLAEHMSQYRRTTDNLNALYCESFGDPESHGRGRDLVKAYMERE